MFSDDKENNFTNDIIKENEEKEPVIFESSEDSQISKTKEPEMFEKLDLEEDFEIPAFLRKQKN